MTRRGRKQVKPVTRKMWDFCASMLARWRKSVLDHSGSSHDAKGTECRLTLTTILRLSCVTIGLFLATGACGLDATESPASTDAKMTGLCDVNLTFSLNGGPIITDADGREVSEGTLNRCASITASDMVREKQYAATERALGAPPEVTCEWLGPSARTVLQGIASGATALATVVLGKWCFESVVLVLFLPPHQPPGDNFWAAAGRALRGIEGIAAMTCAGTLAVGQLTLHLGRETGSNADTALAGLRCRRLD